VDWEDDDEDPKFFPDWVYYWAIAISLMVAMWAVGNR
jgi:preprotein translocase subunit Sec61beta